MVPPSAAAEFVVTNISGDRDFRDRRRFRQPSGEINHRTIHAVCSSPSTSSIYNHCPFQLFDFVRDEGSATLWTVIPETRDFSNLPLGGGGSVRAQHEYEFRRQNADLQSSLEPLTHLTSSSALLRISVTLGPDASPCAGRLFLRLTLPSPSGRSALRSFPAVCGFPLDLNSYPRTGYPRGLPKKNNRREPPNPRIQTSREPGRCAIKKPGRGFKAKILAPSRPHPCKETLSTEPSG